jgi:hypothetical protein
MPTFGLVHEVPEKRILLMGPFMPARSKCLWAKWPVRITVATPERHAIVKQGQSLLDCLIEGEQITYRDQ